MELEVITPPKELLRKAISVSFEHGLTIYDAIYVALSDILKAALITEDKELVNKLKVKELEGFYRVSL